MCTNHSTSKTDLVHVFISQAWSVIGGILWTMKQLMFIFFLLLLNGASTGSPAKHIFKDYEKDIRPNCVNGPVNVSINVALRQLIGLDEPNQVVKANLWMRTEWTDCRLQWNASQYNGQHKIVVPESSIWLPDITLYSSIALDTRGNSEFRAIVHADGTVNFNYPLITESRCVVDVTKFPFDEQHCMYRFGSWSYDGTEIALTTSPMGDLSSTVKNVEWDILSFPAERNILRYSCCPEPYYDVIFTINIRRKPVFYILTLIFPSVLITLMSSMVFILPIASGEKISFTVTLMLALAVFQLILGEMLPPSAETLPLIAIYFGCCMALVGFCCGSAVVALHVYHKGDKPMSKLIRNFFLVRLSRVVCVNYRKSSIEVQKFQEQFQNKISTVEGKSTLSMSDPLSLECLKSRNISVDGGESQAEDWQILAVVVERLTALIFMPSLIIITGVTFSFMTS